MVHLDGNGSRDGKRQKKDDNGEESGGGEGGGGWGSPDNPTHTLTLTFPQVPPKNLPATEPDNRRDIIVEKGEVDSSQQPSQ